MRDVCPIIALIGWVFAIGQFVMTVVRQDANKQIDVPPRQPYHHDIVPPKWYPARRKQKYETDDD